MKAGEQQQIFKTWLKKHKGLLFKVVRAYAFIPDDQYDLFQEIALQLWNSIPNFRGDAADTTWIYRVALYAAIAWTRKEKKHSKVNFWTDWDEQIIIEPQKTSDDRLDWLYEQIGQLNKIDRSLTLLLLDGFSYKEMAKILGISESNVGVKINRIKKYLISKSKEYEHYGV